MKALYVFIALFFAEQALSGLPPTTTKGNGDSTDVTTFKFLFPNVTFTHSGTSATFGTVGVASGGTGVTTLTSNNVILGNGTSAVQFVAPSTSGNALISNGTTWTSAAQGTGTTQVLATGITSPKICIGIFGGTSATLSSPTQCASGTCVEMYDSCGTFSPPAFSSTGLYTNAAWSTGTWANSTAISCFCLAYNVTGNTVDDCTPVWDSGDQTVQTTSGGAYQININSASPSGTQRDGWVVVQCIAAAP